MKRWVCISVFIILFININSYSQQDSIYTFGERPEEIEYYFGFNLIENSFGEMAHFAVIKPLKDGKLEIKLLTREAFLNQAMGRIFSKANPKQENFFEKYEIKDPTIVDDLWRLRYNEYPYKTERAMIIEKHNLNDSAANALPVMNTKGWSTYEPSKEVNSRWRIKSLESNLARIPSKSQMKILESFGISRMSDFIYGEKAFNLLKSMQNPQWVNTYKTSFDE